jgi:phosphatidylglycerophosphate synthase
MHTQTKVKAANFFVIWPRLYALGACISVAIYLFWQSELVFATLSLGLFVLFLRKGSAYWRPYGTLGGVANAITGARLLAILLLLVTQEFLHAYAFFVIGILILIADGLDGYYARKYDTVSVFGDFFDKETDAFFVLAFCVILYEQGLAGVWVIFPGLLRYVFVLLLYVLKIEQVSLSGSFRRRFVGMWFMGTIMGCFVLPEKVYTAAMLFATMILTYSFMRDIYLMLKAPAPQG